MMSSKRLSKLELIPVPVSTVTAKVVTKRRRRGSRSQSTSSSGLSDYIGTLNDPFDVAPPKLGYGTFLATQTATAYIHGTSTAATDGSFSIALGSYPNNIVEFNNSGVNVINWNSNACTNMSAISNSADATRVISGGLRACPLVSSTSVPGLVYAGTVAGMVLPSFVSANSSTTISQMPSAHIGLATYGASGFLRPISDLAIEPFGVTTYGTQSGVIPWSYPVITFQGLPASTTIAWEAVLNLELLPSGYDVNSSGSYNRTGDHGLSSLFPAFSSLFNRISSSLSDPIILDFTEGGPSTNNRSGRNRLASNSMYGSKNARKAKYQFPGSQAQNMSYLSQTLKSNEERANVRVNGDPGTYMASATTGSTRRRQDTSETIFESGVRLASELGPRVAGALATGILARESSQGRGYFAPSA